MSVVIENACNLPYVIARAR